MLLGQPLHPLKHALQIFTDASKEGWGAHLDGHTARGTWSLPESKLHINHLELKAVFLALKEFRTLCCNKTVLIATDNTTVVAYIKKEGGDEVGLSVCPTVENPVLVYQTADNSQGMSHPRLAECDSRQAIQSWPDHSNRVVTSSKSVPSYMLLVAPAPSGPICHQIQQCTQPLLGGTGPIRLSTSSHLGQSGGEVAGLPLQQNNSDCPRVAQHALVLGSSGNVQSNPTVSAQHTKLSVPAIQPVLHRNLSNLNLHAWLLQPQQSRSRASLRQWQHELRLLKEDQPDLSMRQSGPFLKAIADFLLHLFQDKKLQPGTIDGYRSAIADKLGNSTINVSKDENLSRLLDSFHRDRPKGRRGIPSWNLSLVLHQLTKAPFEPLKEASLKHFQDCFLAGLRFW